MFGASSAGPRLSSRFRSSHPRTSPKGDPQPWSQVHINGLLNINGPTTSKLCPDMAIGLLYPCMDSCLGEPHRFKREWSSVLRCVAVFMGIYHASAKIDFANNGQLLLTLAALSVGLWWMFDRSRSGLGLGIGVATLATITTQILLSSGVFQSVLPDILYVHSSLPCIFFAGGITIGNIGRQLALGKQHVE
uniref:Insulin-induced gene 2 protein n=1 Tax=Eptatretus burgeri TaxID=7764 RepID=A0A8C4R9W4_EPTBU